MKIQITFILALVLVFQCAQTAKAAGYGCPIPDNRVCIDFQNQCTSDEQCISEYGSSYKCCLQPNCGLECKASVWTAGRRCPVPDDRVCKRYLDQCTSDTQCMNERGRRYKCCLQPGCGLECKASV